jgi:GT2 family glycosyltransferase
MLKDAVMSILGGDTIPTEILIVDQSDHPDERLATLRGPEGCTIRYLWSDSVGLSRANNLGVAAAAHDLLVFTHDDVRVSRNWFGTIVAQLLREGGRGVVTGRILASLEAAGGYAPTLRTQTERAVYAGRIGYDVLKPLNMAMYRSALEAVGGFDERLGPGTPFPGAEDADLGFRLLDAGYRIVYVPDALLYHRAWRSDSDYLPLRWTYGIAQGAYYAKHLRAGDLHMARRFAMDVLRRVRRFPGRCVRERRKALADPYFVVGNLVGALRWWRLYRTPGGKT